MTRLHRRYHHPRLGELGPIRFAASIPSVVNVGGIRMSVSTASGRCSSTARSSASGSATVSTSSTSAVSVRSSATPSHQVVVVREDNPDRHGSL